MSWASVQQWVLVKRGAAGRSPCWDPRDWSAAHVATYHEMQYQLLVFLCCFAYCGPGSSCLRCQRLRLSPTPFPLVTHLHFNMLHRPSCFFQLMFAFHVLFFALILRPDISVQSLFQQTWGHFLGLRIAPDILFRQFYRGTALSSLAKGEAWEEALELLCELPSRGPEWPRIACQELHYMFTVLEMGKLFLSDQELVHEISAKRCLVFSWNIPNSSRSHRTKRRESVLALAFCITQAGIETGMIRNLVALWHRWLVAISPVAGNWKKKMIESSQVLHRRTSMNQCKDILPRCSVWHIDCSTMNHIDLLALWVRHFYIVDREVKLIIHSRGVYCGTFFEKESMETLLRRNRQQQSHFGLILEVRYRFCFGTGRFRWRWGVNAALSACGRASKWAEADSSRSFGTTQKW